MSAQKSLSRSDAQKKSTAAIRLLRELYKNVNGKDISLQHRKETDGISDLSLTYGEINSQSFLQILALTQTANSSTHPQVFVDLGCGTGKPVFCGVFSPYNFSKVWGIEIIPALTNEAIEIQKKLNEMMELALTAASSSNDDSDSVQIVKPTKPNNNKDKAIDIDAILTKTIAIKSAEIETNVILVASLANELLKQIGHKQYKVFIKQHKTFLRYLKARNELYELSDNDTIIGLATGNITTSTTTAGCVDDSTTSSVHDLAQSDDVQCESPQLETVDYEAQITSLNNSMAEIAISESISTPNDTINNTTNNTTTIATSTIAPHELRLFHPLPEIVFETNSIFEVNWWDSADVVYCASLLFSTEMMELLSEKVMLMRSGSYFITLKPLCLSLRDDYKNRTTLVSESFFKMSWQMAKVYVYRIN